MCVIAVKLKGADFPPLQNIKACCDNNPDGFAMAWNEGDVLKTFRTMSAEEAIARYYTVSTTLDPEQTALVLHARIATHGSKKLANCHGWTDDGNNLAFFHNGILHGIGNRDDLTDSETFFRDWFLPALVRCGSNYAKQLANYVARSEHSRFAIITKDGGIFLSGDWVKEQFENAKGKIYFSNSSYRPRYHYGFSGGETVASLSARSRPAPKEKAVKPMANMTAKEFRRKFGEDVWRKHGEALFGPFRKEDPASTLF